MDGFFFKVFKKLSTPGLPTTNILFLSIPSFNKFFLLVLVGAKCISENDVINLLFNSSGYGFLLSNVLSPASLCAISDPESEDAYAQPAAVVVSP